MFKPRFRHLFRHKKPSIIQKNTWQMRPPSLCYPKVIQLLIIVGVISPIVFSCFMKSVEIHCNPIHPYNPVYWNVHENPIIYEMENGFPNDMILLKWSIVYENPI